MAAVKIKENLSIKYKFIKYFFTDLIIRLNINGSGKHSISKMRLPCSTEKEGMIEGCIVSMGVTIYRGNYKDVIGDH